MTQRAARPEFIPGYLFYGPERPSYPGGNSPYTDRTFTFRGYLLRERNLWTRVMQEWDCRETNISAVGPGEDAPAWLARGEWRARVAGIIADGATMREALDEAWRLAEAEDQLRHLLPPTTADHGRDA